MSIKTTEELLEVLKTVPLSDFMAVGGPLNGKIIDCDRGVYTYVDFSKNGLSIGIDYVLKLLGRGERYVFAYIHPSISDREAEDVLFGR